MDWEFTAYCMSSLIAVLNPIGCLPVYLSLVSERDRSEERRTARIVTISVFIALCVFALLGEHILVFFGIRLPAFRAGGGILILVMAITMLHGRTSPVKHTEAEATEAEQQESVAIVPLAIPILAGPGSASTVILLVHEAQGWAERGILFAAILTSSVIIYSLLRSARFVRSLLGRTGINIVTRIMGLILAAIAIQFIAQGLGELLPGLSGNADHP